MREMHQEVSFLKREQVLLFRYKLFVLFETWALVSNGVREYVGVFFFVSEFANSLVPRTVLRA
jgi:hypothetical protein